MSKKLASTVPMSSQFQCYSCFEHFTNSSRFLIHPSLKVALCTSCFTQHGGNCWHQNSYFSIKDNHQQFCEICAYGGTMLPCDTCSKCYCLECLKNWFPGYHLKALLEDEDTPFECFACISSSCDKLLDLRLEFPRNQKYKKFRSDTVAFQEYYRKHVFGMLTERNKKRKIEDDTFELETEKRFMQLENKNPDLKRNEQNSTQKCESEIKSEIKSPKKVQNISRTRSVQKITNAKFINDSKRGRPRKSVSKALNPPESRESLQNSSNFIEIKIPKNCTKPVKTKTENMLKIDMKNQFAATPKRAPKSSNEQETPTTKISLLQSPKHSKEPSTSEQSLRRVRSYTRKDGTFITGYSTSPKPTKLKNSSEPTNPILRMLRPTKNEKTEIEHKNSSKVSKLSKLSTTPKPTKPASKSEITGIKSTKPTRSTKPTKIVAKRAEQIRTLADLEQVNPKILPVVKYFAISKLQNLKESKRYQHPDLIKVNNQRFDGTMVVKKNGTGFKKNQTICKYPAKLVDIRDLGTKEAINNFESLFWVYMIDGSEPNTCKKDKTGSFYYLSVLVKDAAAQMVAGGCRDCSNVEFIENGKDIDMKAVCQIQGGKKLFNCYGRDYWSQKTDVRNPQCPVCKKCLINNE